MKESIFEEFTLKLNKLRTVCVTQIGYKRNINKAVKSSESY